ncbi:hypothetical protein GCM10027277_44390 [Pseudoduganella ginsengisoli]|uniref:Uncharacterized protein n=1 Tax=Pseudoduganella ginsengisoli TaxID=1462440 RepID=A0A6L6Q394_9BURK|nr:hypothetical protein [Pseudoduganella ginsengisoli]MTW03761.1 hypothetical protein [Pseudoduganella ginsengisoli]
MRYPGPMLFAMALCANNAIAAPRFEDFPATKYTGKIAQVRLADARSRQYASVLRAGVKGAPNFAGHYFLVTWGCGASCITGAAIDAGTGNVTWLPFTVCCWPLQISEPLAFRRDSNLLVTHGALNEMGDSSAMHYHVLENGKFSGK